MSYGLNSPMYPFLLTGSPLNGEWSLAGLPAVAAPAAAGLEASVLAALDAQAPSELMINPPTFSDVHPTGGIYPMLQEGLRTVDEQQGTAILRRLLLRPSELWKRHQQKIWRTTLLIDPLHCPDSLLEHLRAHVGFGAGSGLPDEIAGQLSPANLRKLIKMAVPYWNRRGLRSGLQDAIRTFTGALPAVDDFFYVRFVVGEVLVGIEGEPGSDPWCVYASAFDSGSSGGDTRVEIRAPVQNADLQEIVLDLVSLARPVGEHYGVAFVDWIDALQSGRLAWWTTVQGTAATYVAPSSAVSPPQLGALSCPAGTYERVAPGSEATWTGYVWQGVLSYTANGARPVLRFYVQDNSNYYSVAVTPTGQIFLLKTVGGVVSVLASDITTPTAAAGTRGFLIDVQRNGDDTANVIRIYWDAQLVFGTSVSDNTFTQGPVEIGNAATASAAVQYHRSEVFQRPLRYVEIGPGT